MSSERIKVVDIGIPLYLTVVLSEGFNQDILASHGYADFRNLKEDILSKALIRLLSLYFG